MPSNPSILYGHRFSARAKGWRRRLLPIPMFFQGWNTELELIIERVDEMGAFPDADWFAFLLYPSKDRMPREIDTSGLKRGESRKLSFNPLYSQAGHYEVGIKQRVGEEANFFYSFEVSPDKNLWFALLWFIAWLVPVVLLGLSLLHDSNSTTNVVVNWPTPSVTQSP